tara:strand:- start:250 stop:1101 length:852 start_codon:yes stop_codon:yes gene_type:complete
MFVWLASYPKSGNTLVRSMLSAYYFSSDGVYNFDLIKNIRQFPSAVLFEREGVDISKEKEVLKNYIKVQERINKKNSVQFLKTHSYLFNIENYPFTNLENTLGAIYVVRDPRNVVTSLSNHMNISSKEAAKVMIEDYKFGGNLFSDGSDRTRLYMGTWNGNYNSWKSLKKPKRYLLIKYEDLISNRDLIFRKIIKFLHQLNGSKFIIDQKKFKNVIETTDFERLKNLEKIKGFDEAKINFSTGKKIPFFHLGPKNDWRKILDSKIKKKIEEAFRKEMKELGYI